MPGVLYCLCVCVCACVRACVCVRERERAISDNKQYSMRRHQWAITAVPDENLTVSKSSARFFACR